MEPNFLRQALDLAVQSVRTGGGPFGAVIVQNGEVVATGMNRVTVIQDPSAHAEVQAIRSACQTLGSFSLADCELYASCEPCPMCAATSFWARLPRVWFAATREDAAAAGFDDAALYELFHAGDHKFTHDGPLTMTHVSHDRVREPFAAWQALQSRTRY